MTLEQVASDARKHDDIAAMGTTPAAPPTPDGETVRSAIIARIVSQLDHAYAKHGRDPWARHEFYGVLREEVDELWDAIKTDAPTRDVLDEAMQVACVCIRYAETGDRYRGDHPKPAPRPVQVVEGRVQ